MEQYIDKSALVAEIEKIIEEPAPSHDLQCRWEDGYYSGLYKAESIIDTIEVKEANEELAEAYMQVFDKKFPILPTLKGERLHNFKNFLNKCRQIFGLTEFGFHPVQTKLFGKLALLWAAWGAENLQGIGQVKKGEPDVAKGE